MSEGGSEYIQTMSQESSTWTPELGFPVHPLQFNFCPAEGRESGWELRGLCSSHHFATNQRHDPGQIIFLFVISLSYTVDLTCWDWGVFHDVTLLVLKHGKMPSKLGESGHPSPGVDPFLLCTISSWAVSCVLLTPNTCTCLVTVLCVSPNTSC